MTPISALSLVPAKGAPPGVPPTAGAPGNFLALLSPTVAPTLPRHDDAAPGKDLPATDDSEEADVGVVAPVATWITPPATPSVCPISAAEATADPRAPDETTSDMPAIAATLAPPVPPTPVADATPKGDISPRVVALGPSPIAEKPARAEPIVAPIVQPVPTPTLTSPIAEAAARTEVSPFVATPRLVPLAGTPTIGDPVAASRAFPRGAIDLSSPPSAVPRPAVSIALPNLDLSLTASVSSDTPPIVRSGEFSPPPVDLPIAAEARSVAVTAQDTNATSVPLTTSIVAGPRVAPAAQMFAGALHRAAREERPADIATIPPVATAATDLAPHAIVATHAAQHPSLDMRHDTWPTRMMERIEALRDAADAQDTRIRLIPDRLGAIDVAVTRDGDAVQVQFTAAQAETRQLLADAQPRLTELAEARGLKLTANTGEAGGGQSQQQPRAAAPAPAAPPSVVANDDDLTTDQRIA